MRLLLSGEGPTDIGTTKPTDEGLQFVPGPMAWFVDRLLEKRLGFSLLELDQGGAESVRHVSETELAGVRVARSTPLLPGPRYGKQAFSTRSAQALGQLAHEDASATGQSVIAVLFRDADGTRSVPAKHWRQIFDSIVRGFALVEFASGVPMVPRPKSEAWLICALQTPPYLHCDGLEDAPGNDRSPNALKKRLEALHGHVPSADEQAEWVRTGRIDPAEIPMPSFAEFRSALDRAADVVGLVATHRA